MRVFFVCIAILLSASRSSLANDGIIDLSKIDELIRSGDFKTSVDKLSQAIDQQKKNLAIFYQRRAECYSQRKEYDKAIQDYEEVLDYSVNGRVEFAIGKCLYEQKKYHDALAMFKTAQSKLGSDEATHVQYLYSCYSALALYGTGGFDEAMHNLKQIREEYKNEDMGYIFSMIDENKKNITEKTGLNGEAEGCHDVSEEKSAKE